MIWGYRVIEDHSCLNEPEYFIAEVFFTKKGKPKSYNMMGYLGQYHTGIELKTDLELMLAAFEKRCLMITKRGKLKERP